MGEGEGVSHSLEWIEGLRGRGGGGVFTHIYRGENKVPSSRGQLGPLPLRSRGPHQNPRALT